VDAGEGECELTSIARAIPIASTDRELTAVERIARPSQEEFEARYVRRSRPVILRDAIGDWPAMKLWSCQYFEKRFGNREVPVVRSKGSTLYDPASGLNYEKISIADYVRLLEKGEPVDLYVVFPVQETMPELFDDIIRPPYCGQASWYRSKFFFCGPDSNGILHRDLPENLFAQIVGRKRMLLLDRRCTRRVHRYSFLSGVPNFSPIDAEAPDLARYPRFRDAPLMLAELEPGDLLYIPSLWWHQAHSVDTSLSINQWWVRGPMLPVVKAAEMFMRVRRLRL
jgi:[protein]-arginine 3-hydroxylase / protease